MKPPVPMKHLFYICNTVFSQGLKDFSLSFIQQRASPESNQQKTLLTQIRFVTIDKTSFKVCSIENKITAQGVTWSKL